MSALQVARVFDAVGEDGRPYFSPAVPRLVEPELRSRVIGYLSTAPLALPGFRTDGVWVWPAAMVDHVRTGGVGPTRGLLDHMAGRHHIAPDELPPQVLDRAARAAASGAPSRSREVHALYLAGFRDRAHPPTHLVRRLYNKDGTVDEEALGPHGWEHTESMQGLHGLREVRFEEVSDHQAAEAVDRICSRWHEERVRQARESDVGEHDGAVGLRVARVFDGESPTGGPWFSPNRLRIVEPQWRERLATYLEGGRLVVRATGRAPDPLDPSRGRAVPLSYRTDGVWVWQEALAYYMRSRGAAPELDLLCHIEERACRLPESVPDTIVAMAVAAAKAPMPPRRVSEPTRYFASYGHVGATRLVRARDAEPPCADTLQRDLRWHFVGRVAPDLIEQERDLIEIAEADAVQIVDAWCARGFADATSS